MGRIATRITCCNSDNGILCRLAPVFWGAAVAVAGVVLASDDWDAAIVRFLMGSLVLLTGAAIAASACRAIKAIHDGSIKMCLDALIEDRPSPEPDERHLRAVAESAGG